MMPTPPLTSSNFQFSLQMVSTITLSLVLVLLAGLPEWLLHLDKPTGHRLYLDRSKSRNGSMPSETQWHAKSSN